MDRMAAVDRLRAAKLRVTKQRSAVLSALDAHPHAEADTVAECVRARLGSVSTQGVYDALHALTAAGLTRRFEPAGSAARYESRIGDNHHHAVCRQCGAVADVDCATGVAPCLTASNNAGFVIDEAEVTYWGVCPDCQVVCDPPAASESVYSQAAP